MNLITFDKTTRKPVVRDSKPFITINARGKFNFSQGARRLLDLRDGDRIVLHQDAAYRSDWYFELTRESRGYKIVLSKTDTRFTCRAAAIAIFKSIGQQPQKLTVPLPEKPLAINNASLYKMDVKSAFLFG